MLTRFIRSQEVQNLSGLSRATLWRLEQGGLFPRRKKIGSYAVGWREDEIKQWIDNRPTSAVA